MVRGGSWWFIVVRSGSWWLVVVCGGLWWFMVVSLKFSRKYHVTHYLTRVQDSVSNLILNETLWWFMVVSGGL